MFAPPSRSKRALVIDDRGREDSPEPSADGLHLAEIVLPTERPDDEPLQRFFRIIRIADAPTQECGEIAVAFHQRSAHGSIHFHEAILDVRSVV
jgi:hypothetical protein